MADPTLQARPTVYRGVRMRSRLEAEWAQTFDRNGTPWEYEPCCFADETGQYLPDFRVLLNRRTLAYVEVRGYPCDDDEARRRMQIIWASEPDAVLVYWHAADPLGPWFAGPDHPGWFQA